jgi:ribosomal subunit interface protein
VDIVVKGRKTEVTDRFRKHVEEKLARVERYDGKVINLDVEVSKEPNPRQSERCDRVEITMYTRGPVIRAEACAADPYAALDAATAKLEAILRRAADRRRVHHGRRSPVSVSVATSTLAELEAAELAAALPGSSAPASDPADTAVNGSGPQGKHRVGPLEVEGDGPMVVRVKTHNAPPMDLGQALYEMELVGHDFFLFVDVDSKLPSVVYRRRGYDYGVIHLEESGVATYSANSEPEQQEQRADAGAAVV